MAGAEYLDSPTREMLLVCRRCDDKSDLSGSCRICLTYLHPSEMTQIFRSISTHTWKSVIKSVTNIKVNAGDGLQALVCSLCVKLNHTKDFKEHCIASNILLQNALLQDDKKFDRQNHQLCADADSDLPCADSSGSCRLCAAVFAPGDTTSIFPDDGPDWNE